MEAIRFERQVRTPQSEAYHIFTGAQRLGRVDLHFARYEVYGSVVIEVDLAENEVEELISRIDEELVESAEVEREDFLVTVYRGGEIGFYSDEYEEEET